MNFIMIAQRYVPNSNGVKWMHKICHTINKLGGNAKIAFHPDDIGNCNSVIYGCESHTNPQFNTPLLRPYDDISGAIVMYPEIVTGNPLNAKNVVRLFGNKEGGLNGKRIAYGARDYCVAHSKIIKPDAHQTLFFAEVNLCFHDGGAVPAHERNVDATYVGKGYMFGQTHHVRGTESITRHDPDSQEKLAYMLRKTRYFYTWDSLTSTNLEAFLCGAIPVFMRYAPWSKEEIDMIEIGYMPKLDDEKKVITQQELDFHRIEIRRKISALTNSWDARVFEFMQNAERHFS